MKEKGETGKSRWAPINGNQEMTRIAPVPQRANTFFTRTIIFGAKMVWVPEIEWGVGVLVKKRGCENLSNTGRNFMFNFQNFFKFFRMPELLIQSSQNCPIDFKRYMMIPLLFKKRRNIIRQSVGCLKC